MRDPKMSATTHTLDRSAIAISEPLSGDTVWPTSTVFSTTTPSRGAVTVNDAVRPAAADA